MRNDNFKFRTDSKNTAIAFKEILNITSIKITSKDQDNQSYNLSKYFCYDNYPNIFTDALCLHMKIPRDSFEKNFRSYEK